MLLKCLDWLLWITIVTWEDMVQLVFWQWENSSPTCKGDSFVTLRAFCALCKESNWRNIESEGKKNKLQTHFVKCQSPKLGEPFMNYHFKRFCYWGALVNYWCGESRRQNIWQSGHADGWIAELCIQLWILNNGWNVGPMAHAGKCFFVIICTTAANVPQRSDSYTSNQQFLTESLLNSNSIPECKLW